LNHRWDGGNAFGTWMARGFTQCCRRRERVNSIDTFASGAPFTQVSWSAALNPPAPSQCRTEIDRKVTSHIQRWFNLRTLSRPATTLRKLSGRNILVGPGTKQVDLSLFKEFYFYGERGRHLQFRAEGVQCPEHAGSSTIRTRRSATQPPERFTSAGSPLLFQRTSRQIQLALKLYF